jgi:hypothetical protein
MRLFTVVVWRGAVGLLQVSRIYYRDTRAVDWQGVNRYALSLRRSTRRAMIPQRQRAGYDSAELTFWHREKLDRP